MPTAVFALWIIAAAGWGVIAGGLRRGLRGFSRRTALIAHGLTPPAAVLGCSLVGFGSLYVTIALAAQWWALALVTRFRPERLVASGGLSRLGAWAALTVLGALAATHVIF